MGPAIRQCEAAGQETSVTPAAVEHRGGGRKGGRVWQGGSRGSEKGHKRVTPVLPFR